MTNNQLADSPQLLFGQGGNHQGRGNGGDIGRFSWGWCLVFGKVLVRILGRASTKFRQASSNVGEISGLGRALLALLIAVQRACVPFGRQGGGIKPHHRHHVEQPTRCFAGIHPSPGHHGAVPDEARCHFRDNKVRVQVIMVFSVVHHF